MFELVFLFASLLGQNTRDMRPAREPDWVVLLGAWDKDGRPFLKDLTFTTRYNPNLFSQTARPHQILFDTPEPGFVQTQAGVEVVQDSEGGGEVWQAHTPLLKRWEGAPFKTYRILGPGRNPVNGKLEAEGPESPRLTVSEEGTRLRWEVSVGWQIQVVATVDEGESWHLLGTTKQGEADLGRFSGQDIYIRFQAFRGLTCYLEMFRPGQGILEDSRYFLLPSFFQANQRATMSVNPDFMFYPTSQNLTGYTGKAKVRWDLGKLPFEVNKLFPGKCIQAVFQVEWKNPPPQKDRLESFSMGRALLREPERVKGLLLHRVVHQDGRWRAEAINTLGPLELPGEKVKERRVGGYENFRKPLGDLSFYTFWVITAD